MNLWEVFTESDDCTGTKVGISKKLQMKNRREVKAQVRRGETWERKIKFSFLENGDGDFSFISGGEEWISPYAKQPIAPRQSHAHSQRIKADSEVVWLPLIFTFDDDERHRRYGAVERRDNSWMNIVDRYHLWRLAWRIWSKVHG